MQDLYVKSTDADANAQIQISTSHLVSVGES